MASVILLDEIESKLRCTGDFKEVLDYITSHYATINDYLCQYVMLTPGDWGVWYNLKKLFCIHAQELPSSCLSIVPLVGQFHVGYNATMDSIQVFRFVHEEVGRYVFGAHYQLAKKPKPFRWSLHVTLLHCAWLLIRKNILKKFQGWNRGLQKPQVTSANPQLNENATCTTTHPSHDEDDPPGAAALTTQKDFYKCFLDCRADC